MTRADIPAAMRLKEIAGWNQTAADWGRFLDHSSSGCFVAEIDAAVRGTVATISFERRVAWIGMVLVDPDYRGQGLGTTLLQRAIDHLDELKIPVLKLDATPLGQPLYEKLGFLPEYEIGRWTRRTAPSRPARSPGVGARSSVSSGLLETICKTDREIFGVDRSLLLKSLHEDAPEFTQAIVDSGRLTGYAFGRRGSFADHLGPWIATAPGAARQLLEAFLAGSSREMQIADCLSAHADARDLLQSCEFSYTRPLTRMFRGSNDDPGRPELVCAILGPEFG
jgi:GNAT superfamily N-acetyltransferase